MIIKNKKETIENYFVDASNYKLEAKEVIIPENSDEVKSIVKNCFENNIKITVRGAGTGLTGGAVGNETILSMEKLDKIIDLDLEKMQVRVEPFITWNNLNEELTKKGYFLPPNPTEINSSIGGNVANNASGSRSYKYGATKRWVNYLKIVLANGEEISIHRGQEFAKNNTFKNICNLSIDLEIVNTYKENLKNASGYIMQENMDLIDLFIGSEGTLGVITEIGLDILKIPSEIGAMIVFFDSEMKAVEFAQFLKQNKSNLIDPRLIEFFDERALKLIQPKHSLINENFKAAIWIEQEYDDAKSMNLSIEKWYELIANYTPFHEDTWGAFDFLEQKKMSEFRHDVPLGLNEVISQKDSVKIGTDMAVPDEIFTEYFNYLDVELKTSNIDFIKFGHIANSHIHINLLPSGEIERTIAYNLYDKIVLKSLELGGTVSAEHGVGKIKKKYLLQMYSEEQINVMKKIKKTLDPKLKLNIGNVFDI